MGDRKISALTALAGSGVDAAADLIPIVDMSVADTLKNKSITPQELRAAMFCGALVKKSVDQTGADYASSSVYLAFNTEVYDVGGWHDNVTFNTRLTVPAGFGINYVVLNAQVWISSFTGTVFNLSIHKNGAIVLGGGYQWSTYANGGLITTSSTPQQVIPGDYFEAQFNVGTDTSITIEQELTCFSAYAVG